MFALWVAAVLQPRPVLNKLKHHVERPEGGRDRGLVGTCLNESRREDGQGGESGSLGHPEAICVICLFFLFCCTRSDGVRLTAPSKTSKSPLRS